jgi:transcriptional regulator with XRE-family HTH domain
MIPHFATIQELMIALGEQLRDRRIGRNLQQTALAARAGVTVRTIRDLERGHGGRVASLLKVLKGLEAERWLESLAPKATLSPMALLEGQKKPRSRVRRSQKEGDE